MDLVARYLGAANSQDRLDILQHAGQERLPLSLARDLMYLNLAPAEHIAILRVTDNSDRLAYEDFLTRGLFDWQQNVVSNALWDWATRTDCLLWHRTHALSLDPAIPQRVSYTLLDLAWYGAANRLIDRFTQLDGLEDMSPAFLALLFQRALQWNIESDRLITIGRNILTQIDASNFTKDKTIPYSIAYLIRYEPDDIQSWLKQHGQFNLWHDISKSLLLENTDRKQLRLILQRPYSQRAHGELVLAWPTLWHRDHLEAELVRSALQFFGADKDISGTHVWELFAGIPHKTLAEAVRGIEKDALFARSLRLLGQLIEEDTRIELLNDLRGRLGHAENPAAILEELSQRDRIELNPPGGKESRFGRLFQERILVLTMNKTGDKFPRFETFDQGTSESKDGARHRFIDLAYRNSVSPKPSDETAWDRLAKYWQQPKEEHLEQLSKDARTSEGVFRVCFIDTIGRFKGIDKAALKLLDYIRSSDDDIVRAVIRALAGIGTPRAHQELVAFLTRPNVNVHRQMEIAQLLREADLGNLQAELRSAINDLKTEGDTSGAVLELKEALTALLASTPQSSAPATAVPSNSNAPSTNELEEQLIKKIDDYSRLSSEAKRALRTAQFFHLQVSSAGNGHTIDLSPAIDMQYKALELTFREMFEEPVNELLRTGVLQRKLDVIGYARPIPSAMDEFEAYVSSFGIIKTIPFFSHFKLRKLLRAICQFRPGKRFTLDGLKAFALFFLCFSRKQCRYGLENFFPLPEMNDTDLFEFCKLLHVFQDFRNRAAHEGFHPDAAADLDDIWRQTAAIIQKSLVARQAWEQAQKGANPQRSANGVKRVS